MFVNIWGKKYGMKYMAQNIMIRCCIFMEAQGQAVWIL